MSRYKCACENQREFNGELAIHFPGIKGLQKPIVWVFPKVRVCLDCGYADFTVPEVDRLFEVYDPAEEAVKSFLPHPEAAAS